MSGFHAVLWVTAAAPSAASTPSLPSPMPRAAPGSATTWKSFPDFWLPGFIAEYPMRNEIGDQFEAIVKEMLRRRAGGVD